MIVNKCITLAKHFVILAFHSVLEHAIKMQSQPKPKTQIQIDIMKYFYISCF